MQAITYANYGGPEVLAISDIPTPTPGEGEVLVKVHAASLNPYDWHFMRGSPYVMRLFVGAKKPKFGQLGRDVAGVVEAVGLGVTGFVVGEEIFGAGKGTLADYCICNASQIFAKPNGTMSEAAALPMAASTALQALDEVAKVTPGQRVLINGASGGVGSFAVQIAKARGCHVTTVCSTDNVDLMNKLGADFVIDYTREDVTSGTLQFDVILDLIGNHPLGACREILSPGGIFVNVGTFDEGKMLGPIKRLLQLKTAKRSSSHSLASVNAKFNQETLRILAGLVNSGAVKSVIERTYKLGQVPEAIAHLETKRVRGKIVVQLVA